MQHLNSQMTADIEASDGLLAGRTSLVGSRTSIFTAGSNNTSADGSAAAAAAGSASNSRPASAAAERSGVSGASSVATAEVLDQMSALQQLMQAEAAKHQEQYGDALEVRMLLLSYVASFICSLAGCSTATHSASLLWQRVLHVQFDAWPMDCCTLPNNSCSKGLHAFGRSPACE